MGQFVRSITARVFALTSAVVLAVSTMLRPSHALVVVAHQDCGLVC
jgi:hypothetical protein